MGVPVAGGGRRVWVGSPGQLRGVDQLLSVGAEDGDPGDVGGSQRGGPHDGDGSGGGGGPGGGLLAVAGAGGGLQKKGPCEWRPARSTVIAVPHGLIANCACPDAGPEAALRAMR